MKIKRLYTPPQSGALEVKPQGMLCTSATMFYLGLTNDANDKDLEGRTNVGNWGDSDEWFN